MVSIIIQTYCKKYLFKNNLKLSQPHSQKSVQISLEKIIRTVKGPDNDWNFIETECWIVLLWTFPPRQHSIYFLRLCCENWESLFQQIFCSGCGKVHNKLRRNSIKTYFLFQNFYFTFTKATEIIKGKLEKIFEFNYVVKMLSRTSLLIIFIRFKRFQNINFTSKVVTESYWLKLYFHLVNFYFYKNCDRIQNEWVEVFWTSTYLKM